MGVSEALSTKRAECGMDLSARYCNDPARVIFRFAASGQLHIGWVSVHALAALADCTISSEEGAIAAYRSTWRKVHAVALGLRATGQSIPFVQREDVV
jgi:hypothetical protein